MRKIFILLICLSVLIACEKNQEIEPNLYDQLIGRWQAVEYTYYQTNGQLDTITFGENGDFPFEYSIGIDYSSGFDLQKNDILDLIWGGRNKGQFYHWKVEARDLVIDQGTLVFTINSVDNSFLHLEFNDKKNTYIMAKLK